MWLPSGATPFADMSAGKARALLREHLGHMGIGCASEHSLHDFRRGHARDIAAAGGTPESIKTMGEWVSPAFLKYLDISSVEAHLVVQAHIEESDDDDV